MLLDFPCTGGVFKNIAETGLEQGVEVSSSQFLEL